MILRRGDVWFVSLSSASTTGHGHRLPVLVIHLYAIHTPEISQVHAGLDLLDFGATKKVVSRQKNATRRTYLGGSLSWSRDR